IGHVTPEELTKTMAETDMSNGFANRFAYFYAEKTRDLPSGGKKVDLTAETEELKERIAYAQLPVEMQRTPAAEEYGATIYGPLACHGKGYVAKLTVRGQPIVMRLAMIFALLDASQVDENGDLRGPAQITVEHIKAAYELWKYSVRTVEWAFG